MNFKTIVLFAVIFLCPFAAPAAPGDVDPTFAGLSGVNFAYGLGQDDTAAVLALPDGETIVAGTSKFGFSTRGVLIKHRADGSLDPKFGEDGKFISPAGLTPRFLSASLVPGGKIVALDDYKVMRINADGTLDLTFGEGGVRALGTGRFLKVLSLPDGRVLVLGQDEWTTQNATIAVVRLNADGSFDKTFGAGGRVVLANNGASELSNSLAVLPDGGILLNATFSTPVANATGHRLILAKLRSDGSLDSAFGQKGRATYNFGPITLGGLLAVQDDGKIIAAGRAGEISATVQTYFMRALPNGDLDTEFNGSGVKFLPPGNTWVPRQIEVDGYGKLLVAGTAGIYYSSVLIRLNSNGSFDNTFGVRGQKEIDTINLSAMAIRADGRISLAGREPRYSGSGLQFLIDINLLTLDSNGNPDTQPGGSGQVSTDIGTLFARGEDLIVQPDGKIISVGSLRGDTTPSTSVGFGISRFNAGGLRDETFGGDGAVAFNLCYNTSGRPLKAALQNSSIIVACGGSGELFRIDADGGLDPAFGVNGVAVTPQSMVKIIVQPDGKIVVFGNSSIHRLDANGLTDQTFGSGGTLSLPWPAGTNWTNFAIQPDGKFLTGGRHATGTWPNYVYDMALARFNADGTSDTAFGDNGVVIKDSGYSGEEMVQAMYLDSAGRIILVGEARFRDMFAARFLPDGGLDPEYGTGGIAHIKSNPNNFAEHMLYRSSVMQSNGKIVFAGVSNASYDSTIRINTAGQIDPSWGTNGWAGLSPNTLRSAVNMALDQSGRVLIASSDDYSESVNLRRLKSGEAAAAAITGRVVTATGRSILNALVTVSEGDTVLQTAATGANGRYIFRALPTGRAYTISVNARRYTFAQPSVNLLLEQDVYELDFMSAPGM